ncbi:ML domain-containing protein [Mycena pura]|uniref:Phosphatidylglycerol/phosphatidylinositol transfer protein n=1 Tax=Mycena pura TaxID=153505 RepID=A0AAD6YP39_9AGAR|nr:ML domain-containing protein [Mycena pura]
MFRRVLLLSFAALLLVNAATTGWEYADCGLPSHPLQIESIELFPDPPVPGQDLEVTVKALATKRIEDGATADVTVRLGLVKLLEKKFDMCHEARKLNAAVSCPVDPGTYTIVQAVALPKEIPTGKHCVSKFGVRVRGFTADNEDMMCLDLKLDFMKSISSIFTSPF